MRTDYKPGDPPLKDGTLVHYIDKDRGGEYRVIEHRRPERHSRMPLSISLEEAYPDGAAYIIHPVGVPYKLDNGYRSVIHVRRTSLRVSCPFTEAEEATAVRLGRDAGFVRMVLSTFEQEAGRLARERRESRKKD